MKRYDRDSEREGHHAGYKDGAGTVTQILKHLNQARRFTNIAIPATSIIEPRNRAINMDVSIAASPYLAPNF